jgi:Ni2+-binding GTPase involved in maturation of urease and hydrogenase
VVLVGGFLGAGKTTAIGALGAELSRRGLHVAVITNDQAPGLVDTAIGKRAGWPVAEVAGGCFCCRFDDMLDAVAEVLPSQPDVLLCEPVGSCTDMAATVLNPFKVFYPDCFRLAPFTVLVDPARVRDAVLGEDQGRFVPDVGYIFRKQLEESDVIALTKCDRLDAAEAARLAGLLEQRYERPVLLTAAIEARGIAGWADLLLSQQPAGGHVLSDVDYDTYASGEAALGWLNATVRLSHAAGFDGQVFAATLLEDVRSACGREGAEIAHLKAAIDGGAAAFVRAHLTSTTASATYHAESPARMTRATLILNARVGIAPERLEDVVVSAIRHAAAQSGVTMEIEALRCFSPSYPRPPYRMPGVR